MYIHSRFRATASCYSCTATLYAGRGTPYAVQGGPSHIISFSGEHFTVAGGGLGSRSSPLHYGESWSIESARRRSVLYTMVLQDSLPFSFYIRRLMRSRPSTGSSRSRHGEVQEVTPHAHWREAQGQVRRPQRARVVKERRASRRVSRLIWPSWPRWRPRSRRPRRPQQPAPGPAPAHDSSH